MIKAVREAKVHTAWLRPDEEYENGYVAFVEALLTPGKDNSFLSQLENFQKTHCRLRHLQLARSTAAKANRPWCSRLLPGHRTLGLKPSRPRQPPFG